jgi:hypothetical protein
MHDIKRNVDRYKYAKHVVDCKHEYGNMHIEMDPLHIIQTEYKIEHLREILQTYISKNGPNIE